jgi:hypothetical protein
MSVDAFILPFILISRFVCPIIIDEAFNPILSIAPELSIPPTVATEKLISGSLINTLYPGFANSILLISKIVVVVVSVMIVLNPG